MPFRNMHAAHRSIDVPRGEAAIDTTLQAISVGLATIFISGELFLTMNHRNEYLRFSLDIDHPLIIDEAYQVYSYIFPLREPV